jgi:hypothetical protein
VHLVGIAQSFGLFLVVCLTTAAVLSLAMAALAGMERAALPVSRRPQRPDPDQSVDRVSSPGSCTYRPRVR